MVLVTTRFLHTCIMQRSYCTDCSNIGFQCRHSVGTQSCWVVSHNTKTDTDNQRRMVQHWGSFNLIPSNSLTAAEIFPQSWAWLAPRAAADGINSPRKLSSDFSDHAAFKLTWIFTHFYFALCRRSHAFLNASGPKCMVPKPSQLYVVG